jgi:hypothetical protein
MIMKFLHQNVEGIVIAINLSDWHIFRYGVHLSDEDATM